MLLANRTHVVGDRRKYFVAYSNWLQLTETVVTATVTSSANDAAIDTVQISADGLQVSFFLNGGAVGEVFTVTITIATNLPEIKTDTISFTCVPVTAAA